MPQLALRRIRAQYTWQRGQCGLDTAKDYREMRMSLRQKFLAKLPVVAKFALVSGLAVVLAGCGGGSGIGSRLFDAGAATDQGKAAGNPTFTGQEAALNRGAGGNRNTIWNLFNNSADANTTLEVNKYLWKASLEVLDFLPIESIDPFTGVIVTGFGTPPGGGKAYRATVLVQDPALDARSLKIAMQSSGGSAVSPDTIRAVEDAIMTRARQLRVQDGKL
jgi:hypothetical protein